jgi:hypothetical protein
MPIPGQKITVNDPGLGLTPAAVTSFLFLGTSSIGTVSQLYPFSNKRDVLDTLGQGPLPENLCRTLDLAGGPVYGMRLAGSIPATAGAVTPVPISTSTGTVAVAGEPFDAYDAQIQIMTSGTVGVGRFRYSLDASSLLTEDQYSWSEVITIPTGGTFAIPNTNLTLTFTPGLGPVMFENGDVFKFTCTAPHYDNDKLAEAVTALLARPTEFAAIVLCGKPVSASASAVTFASLATHMASFVEQFRFMRALIDVGIDTPEDVIEAYAMTASPKGLVSAVYGDAAMASSKPFPGWGTPKMPALNAVAARAARVEISTDLGRFNEGPLEGVVAISHDEFRTTLLDEQKITTLRTFQGAQGFYITNGRLKSQLGSDFLYWQHGRCMDVACDTTTKAQMPFINRSVRTNPGTGTIDARDAATMEATIKSALSERLLSPSNAEGTPGHVSAIDYQISRENNVTVSFEVLSKVAIQPLGYAKTLVTDIGFAIIGG